MQLNAFEEKVKKKKKKKRGRDGEKDKNTHFNDINICII